MRDQAKALVQRYFDALARDDLGDLPALLADEYIEHGPARGRGPGAVQEAARQLRAAFPDLQRTLLHVVAEDDFVAVHVRVTGTHRGQLGALPATGRAVDFTALQLFRAEDGRLAEHWELFDDTSLQRQLAGQG
jgi:steroid delta-isomerase-like uncharacterized protein